MVEQDKNLNINGFRKNEESNDKSGNLTENLRYTSKLKLQKLILTKLMQQEAKSNTSSVKQIKGSLG